MGQLGLLFSAVVFGACGPGTGSEQDLTAQLERLPMPADVRRVGQSYEECPDDSNAMSVCPTLQRWYGIGGDPGPVKDALEALAEDGFEIDVDPDTTMITDGDYFFFVRFGTDARTDPGAPEGTDLEIEVAPVPDL